MYFMPKAQEAEPRPIITGVDGKEFADSLNNPAQMPMSVPTGNATLPKAQFTPSSPSFVGDIVKNVSAVFDSNQTWCDKCKAALPIGQKLALGKPEAVPDVLVGLCKKYNYHRYGKNPDNNKTCEMSYAADGQGGIFAQLLAYADFSDGSSDPSMICSQVFFGACKPPAPTTLSDSFLDNWFSGKREASDDVKARSKKVGPKQDQDKPLRVLWTSDIHVQGRYAVGAEAECSYGYCCNSNSYNTTVYNVTGYLKDTVPSGNISVPAPYWGYEGCDAPWSLVASAFQAVSALGGYDLALYTGDLVAHAETWEESRELVEYSESALYDMMKRHVGDTTVVAAIGNHDSAPTEMAAPHSLPDGRANQFSWDWDYVSKLWESEHWINSSMADTVRTHYGGYSISPRQGLRVISFNTDFWYNGNAFAFINTSDPDMSGVLRFVTDELQAAEDANERAWVVGHVLPGWDGYSSLDAPTNLFYQIVSRYSHTIAAMFFGHTHEDEFSVFYHNTNGNSSSASRKTEDAVAVSFISPSITPLTNMNPGIRVLEVDPETYELMDYHQYYTPLQNVKDKKETDTGLVWYLLYSARDAYGDFKGSVNAGNYSNIVPLNGTKWPSTAPLNATFWSAVADEVETRPELAVQFNLYQGRNSPLSPPCNTQQCASAKSCFMRSGSWALGKSCGSRFSTVQ